MANMTFQFCPKHGKNYPAHESCPDCARNLALSAIDADAQADDLLKPSEERVRDQSGMSIMQKASPTISAVLDAERRRYDQLEQMYRDLERMSMQQGAKLETLSAENKALRDALQEIASQKPSCAIPEDDSPDFQGGYDLCIERARRALTAAQEDT